MILFRWNKWPCLALAVYLAAAILGTFAFTVAETYNFGQSGRNQPVSSGSFNSINHTTDWLAEDASSIGRAKGQGYSPARNGTPRAFMFLGPQNAGLSSAQSSLYAINQRSYSNIKNAIPLKLRI
jgi:hypothetical protein